MLEGLGLIILHYRSIAALKCHWRNLHISDNKAFKMRYTAGRFLQLTMIWKQGIIVQNVMIKVQSRYQKMNL